MLNNKKRRKTKLKLKYPPPHLVELRELEVENIQKYHKAMLMLALTPEKKLVVVGDLWRHSMWKNFWKTLEEKKDIELVALNIDTNEDIQSVSHVKERIIQGLNYIIAKNFVFIGILYLSHGVFNDNLLKSGFLSKRKNKAFLDMQETYRSNDTYPVIDDQTVSVNFIGKGEKFFTFDYQFQKYPKISQTFKGSLNGIVGMNKEENSIDFAILGQNITKEDQPGEVQLDLNGRDALWRLEKSGSFIPISGFKINFGLFGLKELEKWDSLTLLPDFNKHFEIYTQYLEAKMNQEDFPVEITGQVSVFSNGVEIKKQEKIGKQRLSIDEMLENKQEVLLEERIEKKRELEKRQPVSSVDNKKQAEVAVENREMEVIETQKSGNVGLGPSISSQSKAKDLSTRNLPQKPSIQKPSITKPSLKPNSSKSSLSKPSIAKSSIPKSKKSLDKPNLQRISKVKISPANLKTDIDVEDEDYQDVFLQKEEKIFSDEGKTVLREEQIGEKLYHGASRSLDSDLGQSINTNLMSEEDIFKDLESSLEAISQLDKLSTKDQAESRIYYPPPTLISYAEQEGMEIGGSTTVLSMGTGRNLYMIPELKRMQMYGKFYTEEDLNDQIEDFVAMEEKDIETTEQLEDIIHKTFINIKKNNRVFLGVSQIEGNGFESDPGFGFALEQEHMDKLMDIHKKRRKNIEFPRLSEDSYIEVRYHGNTEVIKFLANQESQGVLDIIHDVQNDPRYTKGTIGGIICTDFEAVYFFIITNNFDQLNEEEPVLEIDQKTLNKMFEMIERASLTPVSWIKMDFGFSGFNCLFLWEDVKDSVIIEMVKEKYNYYIGKQLETKQKEDSIKEKLEAQHKDIANIVKKLEIQSKESGKKICTKCGEDVPGDSSFCPICGNPI